MDWLSRLPEKTAVFTAAGERVALHAWQPAQGQAVGDVFRKAAKAWRSGLVRCLPV